MLLNISSVVRTYNLFSTGNKYLGWRTFFLSPPDYDRQTETFSLPRCVWFYPTKILNILWYFSLINRKKCRSHPPRGSQRQYIYLFPIEDIWWILSQSVLHLIPPCRNLGLNNRPTFLGREFRNSRPIKPNKQKHIKIKFLKIFIHDIYIQGNLLLHTNIISLIRNLSR